MPVEHVRVLLLRAKHLFVAAMAAVQRVMGGTVIVAAFPGGDAVLGEALSNRPTTADMRGFLNALTVSAIPACEPLGTPSR